MNSIVAKIILFESNSNRSFKQRKPEENQKPERVSAIKKCLFGVCNPADTEQLLQEQYEIDRARFRERFGFDVNDIENLENQCQVVPPPSPANKSTKNSAEVVSNKLKCASNNSGKRKILNRQRKVFKPYNKQPILTDFYKATKPHLEKGKESKEN